MPSPYADVTWDWDNPNQPCEICLGRGWVELEDASGAPTQRVECPYCKGRKNSLWVAERRHARTHNYNANRLIYKGALFFATGLMWQTRHAWPYYNADSTASAWILLAHWALWILIALGWLVLFMHPERNKKTRRTRHAPGFTTNRERTWLTGLGAGIALKGEIGSQIKKMERGKDA